MAEGTAAQSGPAVGRLPSLAELNCHELFLPQRVPRDYLTSSWVFQLCMKRVHLAASEQGQGKSWRTPGHPSPNRPPTVLCPLGLVPGPAHVIGILCSWVLGVPMKADQAGRQGCSVSEGRGKSAERGADTVAPPGPLITCRLSQWTLPLPQAWLPAASCHCLLGAGMLVLRCCPAYILELPRALASQGDL